MALTGAERQQRYMDKKEDLEVQNQDFLETISIIAHDRKTPTDKRISMILEILDNRKKFDDFDTD